MADKVLKVICVGAGYFADFHLEAWKRMSGVELLAICDLDEQKTAAFARKYQIPKTYADYRKMIQEEEADVIDVITPPASHLEICRYAASLGLHIICQKPLAPSFEEAQELVGVVEAHGVRFMVHENFRFQPWFRLMKEKLSQGLLGDRLHQINFRFRTGDGWQEDAYMNRQPYFRQMPRLLMFETGVHYIDTFRFLGGEISAVYAQLDRWNANIAGEDAGLIVFEFEQGGRAIWDANRYNESQAEDPRFTFGTCWLEGSKGALHLDTDGKISHYPLGGNSTKIPYKLEKKNFAGDCVYATQQHFIEALHAHTAFETSGQDYLKTLRILEAVYESAKRKQRIELSDFTS